MTSEPTAHQAAATTATPTQERPVSRPLAAVLVLAPPILPAAGWLIQLPGFETGPFAVLVGLGLAVGFGSTLWPKHGRWFALILAVITLIAMAVAMVMAAGLTVLVSPAVQESYTLGIWIPLCAPHGAIAFVYPALAAIGVYAVGAVMVVRWPLLWPLIGVASVVAFQIGGNLAQAGGATWTC